MRGWGEGYNTEIYLKKATDNAQFQVNELFFKLSNSYITNVLMLVKRGHMQQFALRKKILTNFDRREVLCEVEFVFGSRQCLYS